jgi:hypothetical protein
MMCNLVNRMRLMKKNQINPTAKPDFGCFARVNTRRDQGPESTKLMQDETTVRKLISVQFRTARTAFRTTSYSFAQFRTTSYSFVQQKCYIQKSAFFCGFSVFFCGKSGLILAFPQNGYLGLLPAL